MTVAGLMHLNNGGLISLGFWPASPHVTAEAKAILPPWAIMCSTVGAVCWAAFFVSAGGRAARRRRRERASARAGEPRTVPRRVV